MAGALRGELSCGRCGERFASRARSCARCGVPRITAASGSIVGGYTGMLGGVFPSTANRRVASLALDLTPVFLFIGSTAVVFSSVQDGDAPDRADVATGVVLAGVALLILYAVAHVILLSVLGRSLGRFALGLRTVGDLTAEPVSLDRFVARLLSFNFSRQTVTADLRRGRDPISLARPPADARALATIELREVPHPDGETDEATRDLLREPVHSQSIALVLDTGDRIEVDSAVLIGRAPVNREGESHLLFSWPDLSRSVSKTHALLEWSGSVLWVTDLQSSNGTALVSPGGERQLLVPGIRGAAAAGWTVQFGERSFDVRPTGAAVIA